MPKSINTSRASSPSTAPKQSPYQTPNILPITSPVSLEIRTELGDDFSISFTPPLSPAQINSRTQLEKDIDELLHGIEIPKQIPIQSPASSQTNNSDAEHQLNLEKAAAFGAGFANRKPHASQEELEQGFQSFMAKISKVATHIETQPDVASKPTPKKRNLESLRDKLQNHDPDNSNALQMNKLRDNVNKRFKIWEKKNISPFTPLQQEFAREELKTMQNLMKQKRGTIFNLDYRQKETARIQSVEQAIKTYPDNPNNAEEDSKPAAKKRKTES